MIFPIYCCVRHCVTTDVQSPDTHSPTLPLQLIKFPHGRALHAARACKVHHHHRCVWPQNNICFFFFLIFFASPTTRSTLIVRMLRHNKKRNIIPDIFGWTPSASSNNRWVGRWVDFSTAIYTVLFLLFRGSGLILPNATGWLTISRLDGADYY